MIKQKAAKAKGEWPRSRFALGVCAAFCAWLCVHYEEDDGGREGESADDGVGRETVREAGSVQTPALGGRDAEADK